MYQIWSWGYLVLIPSSHTGVLFCPRAIALPEELYKSTCHVGLVSGVSFHAG